MIGSNVGNMSPSDFFGDWQNNVDELAESYKNAKPFPHIVIDNFLRDDVADESNSVFPQEPTDKWHRYHNPLEVKYAYNDLSALTTPLPAIFESMGTDYFVSFLQRITQIADLEFDPFLHGAGLHMMPRNGRLHLHLDYEKHPLTSKQRRLNIILFLSKDWDPKWEGGTELWDDELKTKKNVPLKFNRAVIFRTNDTSWHGVPEKITCPPDVWRKSLAYYYVSPLVAKPRSDKFGAGEDGYRHKAAFVATPGVPEHSKYSELYKIRPHRRIEPSDLEQHVPGWDAETD